MIADWLDIETIPAAGEQVEHLSLGIEVIDVEVAVEARRPDVDNQPIADVSFFCCKGQGRRAGWPVSGVRIAAIAQ